MSQISQSINREQFTRIESTDFSYNKNVDNKSTRIAENILNDVSGGKEENASCQKLTNEFSIKARPDNNRISELNAAIELNWNETNINQPSMSSFERVDSNPKYESDNDHSCLQKESLNKLVNEFTVKPRKPVDTMNDNISIADMNWNNAEISHPSMSTYTLESNSVMAESLVEVGSQTSEIKNNSISKYGPLVASTLATILGAVLVIIAKDHGHDEMSVDAADDIVVQEPDYDAIRANAEQEAQEAFEAKWHDPELWGPGKVDGDGVNIETGEKNPYYSAEQDQTTGDFFIGDRLTPEGERTLSEVTKQAGDTAVAQAKADYETALEAAQSHNTGHPDAQHDNNSSGKDHNAMLGIGATLIGVGGLATALIAGNKMTHHSHAKQQAQGQPIEHGPTKNFIEQQLFRVKA
jgi:hypothetical protein